MLLEFFKLAEAKYAKPEIYWHGTSSKFAKQILSQGMLPVPDKRTYADHKKASHSRPSIKTHGGVYMSETLWDALGSSRIAVYEFGGSPLIIKIQVITQSAIIDEDIFLKRVQKIIEDDATASRLPYVSYSYIDGRMRKLLVKYRNLLKTDSTSLSILTNKIHSLFQTKRNMHLDAIHNFIFMYIDRILFHLREQERSAKRRRPIEKTHAIEDKYIEASNRLLSLYKHITLDDGHDGKNIRVLRPIKYKGHTKIAGILKMNFQYEETTTRMVRTSKEPTDIIYGSFTKQEMQYILDAFDDQFHHLIQEK